VMVIDDIIRELIATGATVLEIQRAARAQGVRSLRDDGVEKLLDGLTSYLELARVTI
jgi:type IV pilus assembly protein PilB